MGLIDELSEIANEYAPQLNDINNELSVLKPIDSGAMELLRDIRVASLEYSPLLIEPLIDEINQHLDSCLDLQAIAQSLEREAITDLLSFKRIRKEVELKQQNIELLNNSRVNTESLSKQISLSYSDGVIKGSDESIAKLVEFEGKRLEIEQDILNLEIEINDKISELRKLDGSSFDLNERYSNAKEVFEVEFKELFKKLRSVESGLKNVYKLSGLELPVITDSGYLVELYKYVNKVSNELKKYYQKEQEFVVTIPLKLGYSGPDFEDKHMIYNKPADFDNELKAGMLTFELPSEIFKGFSIVKLRGIKISVRWDAAVTAADRWNFEVKVPSPTNGAGDKLWEIPSFRTVGLIASNPGFIYPGSRDLSVYNAPIEGEWTIKIPKTSTSNRSLTTSGIFDIWMELLVSGKK